MAGCRWQKVTRYFCRYTVSNDHVLLTWIISFDSADSDGSANVRCTKICGNWESVGIARPDHCASFVSSVPFASRDSESSGRPE